MATNYKAVGVHYYKRQCKTLEAMLSAKKAECEALQNDLHAAYVKIRILDNQFRAAQDVINGDVNLLRGTEYVPA